MRIGWSTCRTLHFTWKGFYFHFCRSLARRRSFGSSRYPLLHVKVTRDEERLRGRLLLSHKKRLPSHVSNISGYCDPYKVTNKMALYRIAQFQSLITWTEKKCSCCCCCSFVCLFASLCFVFFFFFTFSAYSKLSKGYERCTPALKCTIITRLLASSSMSRGIESGLRGAALK